jgi:hypothetical protein
LWHGVRGLRSRYKRTGAVDSIVVVWCRGPQVKVEAVDSIQQQPSLFVPSKLWYARSRKKRQKTKVRGTKGQTGKKRKGNKKLKHKKVKKANKKTNIKRQ